jgi:divalent metal cation (Fe/Co/Zn/Cd) transporter
MGVAAIILGYYIADSSVAIVVGIMMLALVLGPTSSALPSPSC